MLVGAFPQSAPAGGGNEEATTCRAVSQGAAFVGKEVTLLGTFVGWDLVGGQPLDDPMRFAYRCKTQEGKDDGKVQLAFSSKGPLLATHTPAAARVIDPASSIDKALLALNAYSASPIRMTSESKDTKTLLRITGVVKRVFRTNQGPGILLQDVKVDVAK